MALWAKVLDAELHDPGAHMEGENQLHVILCPPNVYYGKRFYA